MWVVFENKPFGDVIGSPAAPYLNKLARECGLATNYFAVSHPSLPNYLALTSGSTHGIGDDGPPATHPLRGPSIFSQLGADWTVLAESMPRPCDRTDGGLYATRHNPAVYYTRLARTCGLDDVRGGIGARGRFTLVAPNLCHDMHDCSVAAGDRWLARNLPPFLAGSAYRAGGVAVFITWDEDDGASSNHVPLIAVSPSTPAGARSAARFDHYSLLGTTEALLGLRCLAAACGARPLRHAFGL